MTKVWCSHFKCPSEVQRGVQKPLQNVSRHGDGQWISWGSENKHRRDLNKETVKKKKKKKKPDKKVNRYINNIPKYPNNFYLLCVFQFWLMLEALSVLKIGYPFGCMETYKVILCWPTKSFSPRAGYRAHIYSASWEDVLGDFREARKVTKGLGPNG